KVIENLTNAGVKAIGIDINMSGPDQFSPQNDSTMLHAIKKSGRVVLAGKVDETTEQLIEEGSSFVTKIKEDYGNIFFTADSSIGIVQPPPDYDGVFRRYLPYIKSNATQKLVPSFGFALLNKYYGLENKTVAKRSDGFFLLGDKKIPRFDRYTVLINFYGAGGTFPRIKLIDVLDGKDFETIDELNTGVDLNTWDDPEIGLLQSGVFKDKIVIIGSTMPEDRDLLPISFAYGKQKGDNIIYGAEFHANIIQNILSNNFLYVQSKESELITIFLLTAFSFYASSFIRKIKFRIGFLLEAANFFLIVFILFGIYKASVFLFINHKLVTVIVSPALAAIVGYFSSTAYHFLKERRQNILIKGMFGQYVSKNVVNELLLNPDKLQLGGERKNVSILFSDIAGFTTFSENKEPEQLVSFINEYLNEMTEIIIANEGTLDKYLGDAIMAFWGAPIEVEEHAYKACLTAVQMQTRLNQLSEKWINASEPNIQVRIGINSGDVIVGNIGGVKRFDYTVMGDNVNLASRLEGANKEYATSTMISEATYEMIHNKVLVRELDLIRVKGKTKPTRVYELIGLTGDPAAEVRLKTLNEYYAGLESYKKRNFETALTHFKKSFELFSDYPSKVYLQRSQNYVANPPPESWDGVFEISPNPPLADLRRSKSGLLTEK
ncbi:MAG: adenylate/guanylate cyclase domain-containing protein, partial [Bacteroidota bacterium]